MLLAGAAAIGHASSQERVPAWVTQAPPSHAMGLWLPDRAVVNGVPSCTASFHDSFFVVGPDGHRYPTWHPPLAQDPATGTDCAFGHEHGRDPRGSQLWRTKQVQRAFYFDANGNGDMDDEEEAWAGLPFGYASAQADLWFAGARLETMRHEDNVGHKVEWANDETDIATHAMSTDTDRGVWVGQLGAGAVQRDTGMRCFFLGKVHQGTSTPDAFRHNLHEIMFFQDCRHETDLARCVDVHDLSSCPDAHPMNARVSLTVLHPFGESGGFTSFAPLCGEERRGDSQDRVAAGHSEYSRRYPDGPGGREIVTRECVERGFLVEAPAFSGNSYEAWSASLSVRTADGARLVEGPDLLFDVNDAVRYYYPEALKVEQGYDRLHPELAGTNLGYVQDLCSERLGSRTARHALCDASTQYGARPGVSWNDPLAGFRGISRGMYFKPVVLRNARGPSVWYTDPFGGRASKSAFPGAIRQQFSTRALDYRTLIQGAPLDPRVAMRQHDDGRRTVHAPN